MAISGSSGCGSMRDCRSDWRMPGACFQLFAFQNSQSRLDVTRLAISDCGKTRGEETIPTSRAKDAREMGHPSVLFTGRRWTTGRGERRVDGNFVSRLGCVKVQRDHAVRAWFDVHSCGLKSAWKAHPLRRASLAQGRLSRKKRGNGAATPLGNL